MPQVTLYLDAETLQLMREKAEAAGLPYSRWVAKLIRGEAASTWPADLALSLGSFPEMPLADAVRRTDVPDAPRAPW